MASPTAAGCAALLIESGDATTPATIETRLEAFINQVDGQSGKKIAGGDADSWIETEAIIAALEAGLS